MNEQLSELMQSMQIGFDTTFEMNEFNEPRIRSEMESVKDLLLFILFTKPGQYPSLPTLGYDIQSKLYSFYDEIDENQIMEDICFQCEALRPYFNNGSIIIKKYMYNKKPSLLIRVEGTDNYPDNYMHDSVDNVNNYLVGISFDELNRMVSNIHAQKGG